MARVGHTRWKGVGGVAYVWCMSGTCGSGVVARVSGKCVTLVYTSSLNTASNPESRVTSVGYTEAVSAYGLNKMGNHLNKMCKVHSVQFLGGWLACPGRALAIPGQR